MRLRPAEYEWSDKKVLVTGATGMLGLSVIPQLRKRNATVHAMSRAGDSIPEADESIACDVTSAESVAHALQRTGFDVILHLAGQSQDTDIDPRATFDVNVAGTLNVLEAARLCKPEATVLIASTCAVTAWWRESQSSAAADGAVRPYDASKMCAEIVARCYRDVYGVRLGITRLPNLFGPRDSNLRRLVPGTICQVLRDQSPVIRSDPETRINFLYVDDAAVAMLRFAEQVASGRSAQLTVSIRNIEFMTIREMVNAILAQMDRLDLLPEMTTMGPPTVRRPSVPRGATADEWNLEPDIPLREGLRRTIDWYRHNHTD